MGIVGWMVDSADGALVAAGRSSFGALAGAMGAIILVASTLLLVLVLINFALQTRAMDGRTAVLLVVRLLLINVFALDWVQFNVLATALIEGLDQLGGAMVEAVGGGGPEGAAGFAGAFDDLMAAFGEYLNAATTQMGWMGGAVLTGLGTALISIVGALAGGVLIFARIMLALMVGLAPLMIAASIFEATKDYFHRWLSSLVGYAMYPLVIAGVMSTIIGMSQSLLAQMGDPADAGSIGALLPFFVMVFLATGMIAAIPLIVRSLSGNFMLAAAPDMIGAARGGLSQMRLGTAGVFNTRGSQARAAAGNRGVAETAGALVGAGVRSSVKGGLRIAETMARNRRLETAGVIGVGLKPGAAPPAETGPSRKAAPPPPKVTEAPKP